MGEIRKVGDIYYIEFYARGLLYSKVAGPDPVYAQKLLEETEAQIEGGEALTVVREIDLTVFFQRFLMDVQKEHSLITIQRFTRAADHFTNFLDLHHPSIHRLSQITPSIIEAYKRFLVSSVSPRMANFTILLLREFLEYGIKLGFINDNPTLHIRLVPWPLRNHKMTPRYKLAQELFSKRVGLVRAMKILELSDIARVMHYANLIPLSREDMYN
jgi:hypothetical protein